MNDRIKVNFEGIEGLAGSLNGSVKAIEGHLADLRKQIAHLEASWVGSASGGFQHAKNEWNQSADAMVELLAKIVIAVRTTGDDYRLTENQNEKRWVMG